MINKNLDILFDVFNASSYDTISDYQESELAMFARMKADLGIDEIPVEATNHMAYLLEQVYEKDSAKVLVNLFNAGPSEEGFNIDYDKDYLESELEEGDWFDDDEEHEEMEEEYGEEGYTLYFVYTKNYKHNFREMTPFSNGMEYDGSELMDI